MEVFVAQPSGKSSGKSTSGSKSPESKSGDMPVRKPRKRRRDDDEYDDDDYDDDDYDPRPFRRRGRRYRNQKSRLVYILLALFLGTLGIHNFYIGRTGPAIAQLVITIVSIPLMFVCVGFITIFIPWVWAIIDIVTIERDADDVPMVS
jgi:TM2 domain-containing membrane protein YozV